MARGPKISDKIQQILIDIWLEHNEATAKEIKLLLDKKLGYEGPGLSAIQKILAIVREKVRQKKENPSNQIDIKDRPWNLGQLKDFPIDPEVVPYLLSMQHKRKSESKKPLTVREAIWINRLYKITDINNLDWWAGMYALREKSTEITNTNIDTTDIDFLLANQEPGIETIVKLKIADQMSSMADLWWKNRNFEQVQNESNKNTLNEFCDRFTEDFAVWLYITHRNSIPRDNINNLSIANFKLSLKSWIKKLEDMTEKKRDEIFFETGIAVENILSRTSRSGK
jgi:hypothetical protein